MVDHTKSAVATSEKLAFITPCTKLFVHVSKESFSLSERSLVQLSACRHGAVLH